MVAPANLVQVSVALQLVVISFHMIGAIQMEDAVSTARFMAGGTNAFTWTPQNLIT